MGPPFLPSKLPLPLGDHWIQATSQPKRHLDRFSHFYMAHYCDRPTDRQTDHASRSVTIDRIAVRMAMRPNNNIASHHSVNELKWHI